MQYDAFVSYAGEDRGRFVRPLVRTLLGCGLNIWFDEVKLKPGESLRRSIEEGLCTSLYAIVVLSPAYYRKGWPEWELNTIVELVNTKKLRGLIPVWLDVDAVTVRRYWPGIIDFVAVVGGTIIQKAERIASVISPRADALYFPQHEQFAELAHQYPSVPIYRRILAHSVTPSLAYNALSRRFNGPHVLFTGVEGGQSPGRYTYIGVQASKVIRSCNLRTQITDFRTGKNRTLTCDPLDALKDILADYRHPAMLGLPRSCGFAAGFISYDCGYRWIGVKAKTKRRPSIPDLCFGVFDKVLIFDSATYCCYAVANAGCKGGDLHEAYSSAIASIEEIVGALNSLEAFRTTEAPVSGTKTTIAQSASKKSVATRVASGGDHVCLGDVYSLVTAVRWESNAIASPFNTFWRLLSAIPAPYSYLLEFSDLQLVGYSAEMALRVEKGVVEMRPVTGGLQFAVEKDDEQIRERELLADPSVRAEHTLMVDAARGDLGAICEYGSVLVRELFVTERGVDVLRVASLVGGRLRQGLDVFAAIRSCFPTSGVVGAPKRKAAQIIQELELTPRFPFGGWVCMLDFSGGLDACSTGESLVFSKGKVWTEVGIWINHPTRGDWAWQDAQAKANRLLRYVL